MLIQYDRVKCRCKAEASATARQESSPPPQHSNARRHAMELDGETESFDAKTVFLSMSDILRTTTTVSHSFWRQNSVRNGLMHFFLPPFNENGYWAKKKKNWLLG